MVFPANNKLPYLQLVLCLTALLLLSGCDADSYSEDLRYPSRTDPIFSRDAVPTDEAKYPDRPGILPVMRMEKADALSQTLGPGANPVYELFKSGKVKNPKDISKANRDQLEAVLEKLFGTPAHPKVEGIDAESVRILKLDPETLTQGSRLYRRNCLHCHGLPGDGRGPTAFWVNPHPRDYRQGLFKFTSTGKVVDVGGKKDVVPGNTKPRREDLLRTLRQGLEGTSMPSFVILPAENLEAMVSYVIHLSLRGETEYYVMGELLRSEGNLEDGIEATVRNSLAFFASSPSSGSWLVSQAAEITPDPYPYKPDDEVELKASVKRGYEFFMSDNGCIKCHKDFGRESIFRYDDWGTLVRPTDLTAGVYRGGRRPVDLYWRIFSGINGSGMANFGETLRPKAEDKEKKIDKIWDMVNFLQVLPYPEMRKKYEIQID